MKATHSQREEFVTQLARACPTASNGQFQRLLRLSYAHARLVTANLPEAEITTLRKLARLEAKIVQIAHDMGKLTAIFNGASGYSVALILPDRKKLIVPTSSTEETTP